MNAALVTIFNKLNIFPICSEKQASVSVGVTASVLYPSQTTILDWKEFEDAPFEGLMLLGMSAILALLPFPFYCQRVFMQHY